MLAKPGMLAKNKVEGETGQGRDNANGDSSQERRVLAALEGVALVTRVTW